MRKEFYKHVDGYGSMCRISKTQARKMFYQGYDICIAPVNANMLFLNWSYWHTYRNNDNLNPASKQFDKLVNSHEYYNCNYEMGYYSKFFVSKHAYKKFFGEDY